MEHAPEHLLWANVLLQAIQDASRNESMFTRKEAVRWIWDDSRKGVGSMLWVCDILGVDPWRIRLNYSNRESMKLVRNARNNPKLIRRIAKT